MVTGWFVGCNNSPTLSADYADFADFFNLGNLQCLRIAFDLSFLKQIFSRENLWALLLCLILIALVIFTADSSPTWIYQGF